MLKYSKHKARYCIAVLVLLLTTCCSEARDEAQSLFPPSLLETYDAGSNQFDAQRFRTQIKTESSFWRRHRRVLFLAEGSSDWTGRWADQRIRFAEILKEEYPELDVWAADLELPKLSNPSIKVVAINHRSPFPDTVPKHAFDAVIGMRILCHCLRGEHASDDMMCGGIHSPETHLMKQFLSQIESILDPTQRDSFAFLEGEDRDPTEHSWMDGVIQSAQIRSRENWASVINEMNSKEGQFRWSILPTKQEPQRRKAIVHFM